MCIRRHGVRNILALRHAVRRRYVASSALHYNHHTLPTVDDRKLTGFIEACKHLTRPAQCTEVLFGILVSCWNKDAEFRPVSS